MTRKGVLKQPFGRKGKSKNCCLKMRWVGC